MADISFEQTQPASLSGLTPLAARAIVLAGLAIGAGAAWISVSPAASVEALEAAGPDLTRLLRGMAAIKALLGTALLAGICWRLASPISPAGLAVYGAASAAMGAGLILTWSLTWLAAGAVLLHLGLFGGLIVLARDRAVGQRLHRLLLKR